MPANIYADEGRTGEHVETEQNTADHPSAVLRVSPDRGTFLRLLNDVPQGDGEGLPHYMKLVDQNGDPLPPNTQLEWQIKVAGQHQPVKISEDISNIGDWNQLTLTQQRDTDHIDSTKIGLRQPETNGGGPRSQLDIRDVDELRLMVTSPAVIDWAASSFYVESNGIRGPFQKE